MMILILTLTILFLNALLVSISILFTIDNFRQANIKFIKRVYENHEERIRWLVGIKIGQFVRYFLRDFFKRLKFFHLIMKRH